MNRRGRGRARTGALVLAWACVGGCFFGQFLEGRACDSDRDCGPALACEGGYCGGVLPPESRLCRDGDGDGFGDPAACEVRILADLIDEGWVASQDALDCDDSDPRAYPGAAYLEDPSACMRDVDGDGWGSPVPLPAGLVTGTDCNDNDPGTYPSAAFNEALFDACMTDADGDGWGASEPNLPSSQIGEGAVGTDCDDGDQWTFPGAAFNEAIETEQACRRDRDGDGYGAAWPGIGISSGSDCDDEDAGVTDLSCDVSCPDVDGDGQGGRQGCSPVEPGKGPLMEQVLGFEDCDDFSALTFMGAASFEGAERCMRDADGDGWGDASPPAGVEIGRDCDDDDLGALCVAFDHSCYEAQVPGQDVKIEVLGNGGVIDDHAFDYDYGYVWEGQGEPQWLTVGTSAAYYGDASTTRAYSAQVQLGAQPPETDYVTVHVRDQPFGRSGPSCELVGLLEGEPAPFAYDPATQTNCAGPGVLEPTAHVCMPVADSHLVAHLRADELAGPAIMGVIWGYEDPRHFYLLQWGSGAKPSDTCPATRGIHLKRVSADESPPSRADLCSTDSRANVEVLLGGFVGQSHASWRPGVEYRVEIEHASTGTRLLVCEPGPEGCTIILKHTLVDDSYPRGRFGLYLDGDTALCGGPWTASCLF